ncbi:MAG TPA: hypothetical protein VGT24_06495 [Candidatus Acidoferrales bacterium]|nr:hypothetical protein [Candidatus Acidoferrales bacterium]
MKILERPPANSPASADCHDTALTPPLRGTPAGVTRILHTVLRGGIALFLCLTISAVFIPLNPSMPLPVLDMSWMMAMNQAVAQRLVFGRDIIFTFGPYASIYTELYHPATDRLMIWGSSFLGLAYFVLLLFLGKGQEFYGLFFYGLFLAGLVNSRDTLLFSYPLIMALVVYRMALPDGHAMKLQFAKPFEKAFPILFAPLALLPLIKGSLLPICGVTTALCFMLLWHCGKKVLASVAMVLTTASCMLLWVAANQPILALPRFIWSTTQSISGYTEAMAFPGDPWECVLYILASALILLFVAWTARSSRTSTWFLGASYTLFLFTAFKAGFVRHDPWHNIIAGSSILAAALLLMFVMGIRRSLLPLVMAALVWIYIGPKTIQAAGDNFTVNFRGTFERAYDGARKRFSGGELKNEYDQHISAIRREFPVARMPGTTDIYSSWLLPSESAWAPRPIVQSFAAYTAELAQQNLMHLQSVHAPDNIIFRVDPIDGRFPSLEDGLSWPVLINDYSLVKLDSLAAYLRKRAAAERPAPVMRSDLYSTRHVFGEEVSLPESKEPLFGRLEITPTLLGRILGAFYKPPQLYLSVRSRDGSVKRYRAISGMMKTDFLITPLVKSAEEFALLAAGGNQYLTGNEVKSITISSDDRAGLFWNAAYSLRLRTLDLRKNTEIENSLLFDPVTDAMPASHLPPLAHICEGSVESVNASRPSPGVTTIEGALSITGWMGIAAKDGITPDSVFVLLTSESGRTLYIRAHGARRDDVKRHFNQPGMPDPGYAALIDVSRLKGSYTLGLARMYKGNLSFCQQFRKSLLINP